MYFLTVVNAKEMFLLDHLNDREVFLAVAGKADGKFTSLRGQSLQTTDLS